MLQNVYSLIRMFEMWNNISSFSLKNTCDSQISSMEYDATVENTFFYENHCYFKLRKTLYEYQQRTKLNWGITQ
jgi:hypothetical protein